MIEELENLVNLARDGDQEAITSLYNRGKSIRINSNDFHLKEDAYNEAFLSVMENLENLRSPRAFMSFLKVAYYRMFLNLVRKRPNAAICDDLCWVKWFDVDKRGLSEELNKVNLAISNLSEMDRECLIMFHFEEKSLIQISEELGIPMGTVKRRLHVARKRLGLILEEIGCELIT